MGNVIQRVRRLKKFSGPKVNVVRIQGTDNVRISSMGRRSISAQVSSNLLEAKAKRDRIESNMCLNKDVYIQL